MLASAMEAKRLSAIASRGNWIDGVFKYIGSTFWPESIVGHSLQEPIETQRYHHDSTSRSRTEEEDGLHRETRDARFARESREVARGHSRS